VEQSGVEDEDNHILVYAHLTVIAHRGGGLLFKSFSSSYESCKEQTTSVSYFKQTETWQAKLTSTTTTYLSYLFTTDGLVLQKEEGSEGLV
jgi:hypothetical protein